ncbi:hypothetical protein WOLCODRAFT_137320 [Wolfiporia cocos MD-104 SS10]|uniref:Response regulatory domain-containing protein n=1 Tax=Wolfiporia cocos (strain MD-104) TaxID=742152 RepID=A0A2H3JGL5_WOLCO|nr:hypothetical protein WOLCODRAFT_137320 [Wolfiporia cocos MD-104 SS10]
MPLPSQLGPLQNPRREASSPFGDKPPTIIELPPEYGHFHEMSLELADSVQMVIQTLLQLSPPQVLDPAKEQFSACSLSIPTPSISAMFTSMKNLNYMSANMSVFSLDPLVQQTAAVGERPSRSAQQSDFDVGEMLQSAGDALSGMAAQAGVDLVLFHGDIGMKHVAVKGDESGLSFTLSHVVRQIISTARPGDTIEIGLFIEEAQHLESPTDDVHYSSFSSGRNTPHDLEGPLRCTFHITHKYSPSSPTELSNSSMSEDEHSPTSPSYFPRPQPSFKTLFLRRLLSHVNATLDQDVPPKGLMTGRPCELVVTLDRGSPSVVNPTVCVTSDDPAYSVIPELKISHEPTLEQLSQFVESLRDRKVTLFANSKGSFAQHLTSYLTAWGLDVSHVSTEPEGDAVSEHSERSPESASSAGRDEAFQEQASGSPAATPGVQPSSDALSFCLIDDDVTVLRERLQKIKAEYAYPLHLSARKRPSLAANHRPRSSPQVVRVMGLTPSTAAPAVPPPVVVHFTSLSNFKLVKDAIQSVLIPGFGTSSKLPEVIVIPKPAGPRRVLTALHTAITKPVVDPFFYPTATSPVSPGFHAMSPFFNMNSAAKSPGGRSTASVRTTSDRSARSPKDYPPSSPRGMSDSMEYFSDAAVKLGTSPASGLVIQSPDGQPTGIFFHPKAKGGKSTTPTSQSEHSVHYEHTPRRGTTSRRTSESEQRAAGASETPRRTPRPLVGTVGASMDPREALEGLTMRGMGRQGATEGVSSIIPGESPISAGVLGSSIGESSTPSPVSRTSPPSSRTTSKKKEQAEPLTRTTSTESPTSPSRSTASRRSRRPGLDSLASAPVAGQKKGKPSDTSIVPPISVLIVDDNPINQTILSTFMKKKKIKFDVAQNGEEAVTKWRTGGFHLILMDIQMPVMDGIEATKEIRRMEKVSAMGGFPPTPQSEGQQTPSEASATESRSSATSTPPYRSSVIIVALTASSLQSDRVAALAAGCNDFLTKPVSLHWLNSKIIEWGSIKALQMWADIRPEVVKSISSGQAVQAQNVARRLHVPEGRSTPTDSRSRSSSVSRRAPPTEGAAVVARSLLGGVSEEKTVTPNTPVHDDSPGALSSGSSEIGNLAAAPLAATVSEQMADPERAEDGHREEVVPAGSVQEPAAADIDAAVLDAEHHGITDSAGEEPELLAAAPGRPGSAAELGASEARDESAPAESVESPGRAGEPPQPPPPEEPQ